MVVRKPLNQCQNILGLVTNFQEQEKEGNFLVPLKTARDTSCDSFLPCPCGGSGQIWRLGLLFGLLSVEPGYRWHGHVPGQDPLLATTLAWPQPFCLLLTSPYLLLGIEPKVLHRLGKCSTIKLHPQPCLNFIYLRQDVFKLPRLASNFELSFSLPNSWDYRNALPHLALLNLW